MSQRDYNHVYTCSYLVVQIMQDGQHDGMCIDLLPSITVVAMNRNLVCGVALDWICGTVNFGIMRNKFREAELARRKSVEELAAKLGVTPRQQELRWGW